MLRMPAPRRTAVVLTVALVAALLVAFGMSPRASSHRASASSSQAGAVVKPVRVPQAVTTPGHHQQGPLHLDIASTPPSTTTTVPPSASFSAPDHPVTRVGRDVVAQTGRAPPAA